MFSVPQSKSLSQHIGDRPSKLLPHSYAKISCKPARKPIPGKKQPSKSYKPNVDFKIRASFPSLVSHAATETDGKTKGFDLGVEGKQPKLALEHLSKLQLLGTQKDKVEKL